MNMKDKQKKSNHEKLLDGLIKQYMSEGMSEFDARMKAIMSDESLAMVFPNGYDK
tara:strand:- start:945 stop:1109 length:165 start_codon:yes stop_codon:yes gene_type:complete